MKKIIGGMAVLALVAGSASATIIRYGDVRGPIVDSGQITRDVTSAQSPDIDISWNGDTHFNGVETASSGQGPAGTFKGQGAGATLTSAVAGFTGDAVTMKVESVKQSGVDTVLETYGYGTQLYVGATANWQAGDVVSFSWDEDVLLHYIDTGWMGAALGGSPSDVTITVADIASPTTFANIAMPRTGVQWQFNGSDGVLLKANQLLTISTEAGADSWILESMVVETIPEPATMGLIAGAGGILIFLRRTFMV